MRNSILTSLAFVVLGYTASAQKLTITPQIGFENPFTKVSYNDLAAFEPLHCQKSPALGVRMDYKLKNGQGPFVGIATSRSAVAYRFTNSETGMNDYKTSEGNMQFQLQGGWQVRTKPIYFNKPSKSTKAADNQTPVSAYRSCGSYKSASRCGSKNKSQAYTAPKNQSRFVRIVPSAGLAFNPFAKGGIASKMQDGQNTITYNAGNFTTALITGAGFEFGSGDTRHFTVNINYFKGLGNNAESITTQAGVKTITTNLASQVSGWSVLVGIPFSKHKKTTPMQAEKKKCEYKEYRSRCTRTI